jgi:hypothetical protein
MKLFEQNECCEFNHWRQVTIMGFSPAKRFLNEEGKFRYGVFELAGESTSEIEKELIQRDPDSGINFAVIDASAEGWEPSKTSAFRHDLDFYLFVGISDTNASALKHSIEAAGSPVLCMTTKLSE